MILKLILKYFFIKENKIRIIYVFPIVSIIIGSYVIFMTISIMEGMKENLLYRFDSFNYSEFIHENDYNVLNNNNEINLLNQGYERISLLSDAYNNKIIKVKAYKDINKYLKQKIHKYIIYEMNNFPDNGIYIGDDLSREYRMGIGDTLILSSPVDINIATQNIPSKEVVISGIFSLDIYDYDSNYIICHSSLSDEIFTNVIHRYYVNKNEINDEYLYNIDINSLNDHDMLFNAINLEEKIYLFLGYLVIFISCFMLFSISTLIIIEKQKQLTMLKILGLNNLMIFSIYGVKNIILGGVFSIVGLLLSQMTILLNYKYNIFYYIFSSLPFEVLPMQINFYQIILIICLLIFCTTISGIIPLLLINNKNLYNYAKA